MARGHTPGSGPPARLRRLYRGLQAMVGAVLVAGLVVGDVGTVVNAALGLAVTFLPAVLERDHRITLPMGLTVFLATTVLLHSLGMVGLYEGVPWWDHLTHLLSGSIVAGVGYSTARALDLHSTAVSFPPGFLFVYVLVFTLALGVVWEVLEFAARGLADLVGAEPVLVQYGLGDTMLDLVFDAAGAVLFALFGTPHWRAVTDSLADRLDGVEFAGRGD